MPIPGHGLTGPTGSYTPVHECAAETVAKAQTNAANTNILDK